MANTAPARIGMDDVEAEEREIEAIGHERQTADDGAAEACDPESAGISGVEAFRVLQAGIPPFAGRPVHECIDLRPACPPYFQSITHCNHVRAPTRWMKSCTHMQDYFNFCRSGGYLDRFVELSAEADVQYPSRRLQAFRRKIHDRDPVRRRDRKSTRLNY